jgi:uncharacterized membrane protein YphA (DoxX/SURF4 family)
MKQKAISLHNPSRRQIDIKKIAVEIIVAILIIIWLHTGISKLLDWRSFSLQMHQSPIFHSYAKIVTFAGPILEIILAILLIFKRTRLIGMIGSFFLMLFFTWYVWWLMTNLPKLPCSCGGIVGFLNWPQHLALNIFLTAIAFIGIVLLHKQFRSNKM